MSSIVHSTARPIDGERHAPRSLAKRSADISMASPAHVEKSRSQRSAAATTAAMPLSSTRSCATSGQTISRQTRLAVAVVDAGPLYAVVNADDRDHERCLDVLARRDLQLVVPALVVAEVLYMIGRRMGSRQEAQFVRGLESFVVEGPAPAEWTRIGELVEQYADLPLGGTDASVVALAERIDARIVITIDRRHFPVVRPRHCDAFELLPA